MLDAYRLPGTKEPTPSPRKPGPIDYLFGVMLWLSPLAVPALSAVMLWVGVFGTLFSSSDFRGNLFLALGFGYLFVALPLSVLAIMRRNTHPHFTQQVQLGIYSFPAILMFLGVGATDELGAMIFHPFTGIVYIAIIASITYAWLHAVTRQSVR